jgi:transcriptional regulator with XRE-family HTH domain
MSPSARRIHKSVHTPEHRALRELLVEARDKADLTQQKLAKRLGRPQSFVAKYEGGERRLDVIEFITIARVIGADPKRLFGALLRKIG